jgi:hypothetical protein
MLVRSESPHYRTRDCVLPKGKQSYNIVRRSFSELVLRCDKRRRSGIRPAALREGAGTGRESR